MSRNYQDLERNENPVEGESVVDEEEYRDQPAALPAAPTKVKLDLDKESALTYLTDYSSISRGGLSGSDLTSGCPSSQLVARLEFLTNQLENERTQREQLDSKVRMLEKKQEEREHERMMFMLDLHKPKNHLEKTI